ncbi:hypothetical protein Q7C36_012046 [Tachysurus vachellii]|uniref:Uncharacterized protein n=1 Tax=Tachysurus vachellii TaxID=175792 RepID=A0AA88MSD1_TACVA|nr:hypothetical protein Q7C36_012046 [Tachysurus vachellii]
MRKVLRSDSDPRYSSELLSKNTVEVRAISRQSPRSSQIPSAFLRSEEREVVRKDAAGRAMLSALYWLRREL